MPLARYDRFYGGTKGAASKALTALKDQYGERKGTSVFYALKSKRAKEGRSYKRIQER